MGKVNFKFTNTSDEERKEESDQNNINLDNIESNKEDEIRKSASASSPDPANRETANNIKTFNSPGELKQILAELREKAKYDPLPELEQDHYIWKKLLQLAEKQDQDTYNLLHYLRCQRCKLKLARDNKSHPILKLALEDSPYLLEQHMTDEELGIDNTKSKHEQLSLMHRPGDRYKESNKQRQKNKRIEKRKRELEEVARKRVLDEIVMPKVKEVKMTFDMIRPLLKKAENDVGVISFSLKSFNDFLERRERGYV